MKDKIKYLLSNNEKIVIGIDGNSAAGKTTLANELSQYFHCPIVHMDDFFLQDFQRTTERLNKVGGNIDYERFQREVMKPIKNKCDFTYHVFNCQTMNFTEEKRITFKSLIIIEGAYSLHPLFQDIYDLKIFMNLSQAEQINRIQKRNGTELLKRFINEWIPKENSYFDKLKIREVCDIILN